MEIPEDVTVLKRHELQRLCKAHGIKANMKNVQMMSALEECRKELLMKAEVAEGEPVNEEVDQPLKMEEKEEEALESNRDKVKEAAIAMEQEVRKEEEEEKAALVEEEKVIQKEEELITDMKDETAMEVSMVEQGEQEVLPMVRHLVEEDSNGNIATTLVPQQQNMEEEEGCGQVLQQCDEHDDAMCGQEMQEDVAVDRGTCSEVGGDTSDNKLNTTYTIESPEHLVDDPNDALSSSLLCHDSSKSPSTPLQGSWALTSIDHGLSVRDSPLLVNQQAQQSCATSIVAEKENKSHHDDIMALLDARVQERKQDPSYCPKEMTDMGLSTKIPVRSEIGHRFSKAHRREFGQMKSIKDELDDRKRRRTPYHNSAKSREPLTKKPKMDPSITEATIKDNKHSKQGKQTVPSTTPRHAKRTLAHPQNTPRPSVSHSHKTPHHQQKQSKYTPYKGRLPLYKDTTSKY